MTAICALYGRIVSPSYFRQSVPMKHMYPVACRAPQAPCQASNTAAECAALPVSTISPLCHVCLVKEGVSGIPGHFEGVQKSVVQCWNHSFNVYMPKHCSVSGIPAELSLQLVFDGLGLPEHGEESWTVLSENSRGVSTDTSLPLSAKMQ